MRKVEPGDTGTQVGVLPAALSAKRRRLSCWTATWKLVAAAVSLDESQIERLNRRG